MEWIKRALKTIPPLRDLVRARDALSKERDALVIERDAARAMVCALNAERDALVRERDRLQYWAGAGPHHVPPGHYYSPVPAVADVRAQADRIFGPMPRTLAGIDLNEEGQLALLSALERYYPELPFAAKPQAGHRYGLDNPGYAWSDGIFLYAMLRHLAPRRIVEIGSGNSSCLILDVNDLYFGGRVKCTFIEPEPARFQSLIRPDERDAVDLAATPLQDVPLATFETLAAGDILFVDSSHVSKAGSDVNHLFAEVLPRLRAGVYVHFHDVFHPFEYPSEWVYAGRAFNEAYVLRAFLAFNDCFEIVLFNTFLERFHTERFAARMPLCLRNWGGSIWLRRR